MHSPRGSDARGHGVVSGGDGYRGGVGGGGGLGGFGGGLGGGCGEGG